MANDPEDKQPERPYRVGKGKPPRESQWKPGQSGNPKGPPKQSGPVEIDIDNLLDGPVTVAQDGTEKKMLPKEVELRQILKKALKGDLRSIDYLLEQFDKYGAIQLPEAIRNHGVAVLPKTIPWRLNLMMLDRFGPPPWTKSQVEALRPEYEATRTEQEVRADEAGIFSFEPGSGSAGGT